VERAGSVSSGGVFTLAAAVEGADGSNALPDPDEARSRFRPGKRAGGTCTEAL